MSKILEKQLLAADIVKDALTYHASLPETQEWVKNTGIVNQLLNGAVNTELIRRMGSLIQMKIDISIAKAIWKLLITCHVSDRDIIMELFMQCLPKMSKDDLTAFFSEVDFHSISMQNQAKLLPVLVKIDEQKTRELIRSIIDLSNEADFPDLEAKFITRDASLKQMFKDELTNRLADPKPIVIKLVSSMIRAKEIEYEYLYQLISLIEINPRVEYFDIVITIFDTYQLVMPSEVLEQLIESSKGSASIWYFCKFLLARGLDYFQPECLEIFKRESQNYRKGDIEYLRFLKMFSMTLEMINGNLKSRVYTAAKTRSLPKDYVFTKFPQTIHNFEKPFLDDNEKVSTLAKDFIFQFFTHIDQVNYKEVADFVLSLKQSIETDDQMYNWFDLCTSVIRNYEEYFDISELGYQKSATKSDDSQIVVECKYEGQSYFVPVSLYASPNVLRQKLHFLHNFPNFVLAKGALSIMTYHQLFEAGIDKKNTVLTIQTKSYSLKPYIIQTTLPSIELFKAGVTKICISALSKQGNTKLTKKAFELLNLLPVDEDVVNFDITNDISEDLLSYILGILKFRQIDDTLYVKLGEKLKQILNDTKHWDKSTVEPLIQIFDSSVRPIIPFFSTDVAKYLSESSKAVSLFEKLIELEHSNKDRQIPVDKSLDSNIDVILDQCTKLSKEDFEKIINVLSFYVEDAFTVCKKCLAKTRQQRFSQIFTLFIKKLTNEDEISLILTDMLKEIQENPLLCTFVEQIVTQKPQFTKLCEPYKETLFNIVLQTIGPQQNSALTILHSMNAEKEFKDRISEFIDFKITTWSNSECTESNVEGNTKQETGHVGLRNLGATCYMNSVIQQIASYNSIVNLIFEAKDEDGNALPELKQLLADLANGNNSCDPTDFVKNWKGWGKRPVNPHEQQDSLEFLQYLLDTMPADVNRHFQGQWINVIRNEEEKLEAKNTENFFSIQIDIQKRSNKKVIPIEEQLKTVENFPEYTLGDKTVPVTKTTTVLKFPEILVIQLKRFDYDLNTFERIKLNEYYEFQKELTLQDESSNDNHYTLKGIVAHSGTALGGHYTSYINDRDKDVWLKFDDNHVTFASQKELKSLYGKSEYSYRESYAANAYLLFYIRDDLAEIENKTSVKVPQVYSERTKVRNTELLHKTILFTKAVFDLCISAGFTVDYYFNVFMHTSFVQYTTKMTKELMSLDKMSLFTEIKERHIDDVENCLLHCPQMEIAETLTDLLSYLSDLFDDEFADRIIQLIHKSGVQWRSVLHISPIIHKYVINHRERTQHVCDEVCSYLRNYYSSTSASFSNTDFSELFRILSMCDIDSIKGTINEISQRAIMSDVHKEVFQELYSSTIDYRAIKDLIAADSNKNQEMIPKIFRAAFIRAKTEEEMQSVIDVLQYSQKNEQVYKSIILDISLLTSNAPNYAEKISDYAERIIFDTLKNETAKETMKRLALYLCFMLIPKAPIPNFKGTVTEFKRINKDFTRSLIERENKCFEITDSDKHIATNLMKGVTEFLTHIINNPEDFSFPPSSTTMVYKPHPTSTSSSQQSHNAKTDGSGQSDSKQTKNMWESRLRLKTVPKSYSSQTSQIQKDTQKTSQIRTSTSSNNSLTTSHQKQNQLTVMTDGSHQAASQKAADSGQKKNTWGSGNDQTNPFVKTSPTKEKETTQKSPTVSSPTKEKISFTTNSGKTAQLFAVNSFTQIALFVGQIIGYDTVAALLPDVLQKLSDDSLNAAKHVAIIGILIAKTGQHDLTSLYLNECIKVKPLELSTNVVPHFLYFISMISPDQLLDALTFEATSKIFSAAIQGFDTSYKETLVLVYSLMEDERAQVFLNNVFHLLQYSSSKVPAYLSLCQPVIEYLSKENKTKMMDFSVRRLEELINQAATATTFKYKSALEFTSQMMFLVDAVPDFEFDKSFVMKITAVDDKSAANQFKQILKHVKIEAPPPEIGTMTKVEEMIQKHDMDGLLTIKTQLPTMKQSQFYKTISNHPEIFAEYTQYFFIPDKMDFQNKKIYKEGLKELDDNTVLDMFLVLSEKSNSVYTKEKLKFIYDTKTNLRDFINENTDFKR